MAVEELFSHYERPKTAILMGHAPRGVALSRRHPRDTGLSLSTDAGEAIPHGNGHASKDQIQQAIQLEFD